MQGIIQQNYQGIEALQIKSIEEGPLTPLSVMIRNKFVPVLPYDWQTESGALTEIRPVQLPIVIGYGFGGIVEQVGRLRHSSLIGQRVIGMQPNGSAQEVINNKIPPLLFKVPDQVTLADAITLIGGADAALHAIKALQIQSTDTVLVTGASGGVGTYLIQLLKLAGATVIALASAENQAFVRQLGADSVLNYEADLATQFSNNSQPNKVIDTVGQQALLQLISTSYGSLRILSLSTIDFLPTNPGQDFRFSNGSIGIGGYQHLLQLLATQQIKDDIQATYSFEDVKKAQMIAKNEHSQGRILLTF
ncbi:zinc-binding dehydrogenase [Latilactobacillus curvatus]